VRDSIRLEYRHVCGRSLHFFPLFLIGASLAIFGCSKQQAAAPARAAVPVVVGKVEERTVPLEVSAIGNVEAYATVSIRSQVAGQLLEVHFKEGDSVHKDQLLFTIDPRPYEAALAQSEAQLARDKAVAANNHLDAQRYKELFDAGIGTQQQSDTSMSAANAADALVRADEASLQTAKLNLEYCKIYSPVDGRTGSLMVKPGNLVKVADVPRVVINEVAPIYVNFTVAQQYLFDIKKYMAQGQLRVAATVPSDPGPPEQGVLTFVDNAVDVATGTIHLRATFENVQNRLWPGLFVNTVLTLTQQAHAAVIPSQAITNGQNGTMVFVVKPDSTVEARPVVSSRTIADAAVVDKGLQPGETIVTDGQVRLVPGVRVQVTNGSKSDSAGENSSGTGKNSEGDTGGQRRQRD